MNCSHFNYCGTSLVGRCSQTLVVLTIGLVSTSYTQAELILFSGNPSGYMPALHDAGIHHRNLLFNDSSLTLQGHTVEGRLNGAVGNDDDDDLNLSLSAFAADSGSTGDGGSTDRVTVTSTSMLNAGGGQAPGIAGMDGSFFDALFAPHSENDGTMFRSLSFNIDANGNEIGNVAVRFFDATGAEIGDTPFEFEIANGNNFFGAIGGQELLFSSVVLTSNAPIDGITQIRATLAPLEAEPPGDPGDPGDPGGPGDPTVHTPEPASVLAWLVVLIFALTFWRRKSRK